ncbi:MAG: hypothetical protein LBI35_04560 [Burkholderiales bacterium]|nr:hypothetical protein [Burkholderiales bacterium]
MIFLSATPLLAFAQNQKAEAVPREIKLEQDTCTRCKMVLKDRLNSAQIIDPETGEMLMFDDLGCAVAWLDEKKPAWRSNAVVYVNDATDGTWLRMDEAVLASPYPTPMKFDIAAFRTKEKVGADKTVLSKQEAEKLILETVSERRRKREQQQKQQKKP